MGIFSRTKKTNENLHTIVLGEDRTLNHKNLLSTALCVQDDTNLLAHDSQPGAIGSYYKGSGDKAKFCGPIFMVVEAMARPFAYNELGWSSVQRKAEVILASARRQAQAKTTEDRERGNRFDRMSNILLLVCCIVGILAILFIVNSGVLTQLFG